MSNYVIAGATLPDGTRTDLFVADGVLVDEAPTGRSRLTPTG